SPTSRRNHRGVLSVAQIDRIKELREIEGWSINKIAKTVKHSWATVKKYADEPVDLQTRGRRTRTSPVIGPYEHIIDAWLAEDQRRPVKQRRTAEKLYRDLCDLGYEGSSRTVRRYVRQRKLELKAAANGQFVRLHHPPGTAQVDFGEFRAIYRGKEVTCYHLTTISHPWPVEPVVFLRRRPSRRSLETRTWRPCVHPVIKAHDHHFAPTISHFPCAQRDSFSRWLFQS